MLNQNIDIVTSIYNEFDDPDSLYVTFTLSWENYDETYTMRKEEIYDFIGYLNMGIDACETDIIESNQVIDRSWESINQIDSTNRAVGAYDRTYPAADRSNCRRLLFQAIVCMNSLIQNSQLPPSE